MAAPRNPENVDIPYKSDTKEYRSEYRKRAYAKLSDDQKEVLKQKNREIKRTEQQKEQRRKQRKPVSKEQRIREALMKRVRNMLKAGFLDYEEYKKYKRNKQKITLMKTVEKRFGSDAQREETRIIRDQWRNYRKRVTAGEAVGGRIPKGWLTTLWIAQNGCCGICGKELDTEWHIDHILPISKGGPNVSWNLQLAHPLCNIAKGAG